MMPNNQPTANYYLSQSDSLEPQLPQGSPASQPPTPVGNAPYAVDQSAKPQSISKIARVILSIGIGVIVVNLAMLIWTGITLKSSTPSVAIGPAMIWGMILFGSIPIAITTIILAVVHLIRDSVSARDIATSVGGIVLCLIPVAFILFIFLARG